jgi:hypothetical protein
MIMAQVAGSGTAETLMAFQAALKYFSYLEVLFRKNTRICCSRVTRKLRLY